LSHGEECLNIDWLRQHRRHLFYNFVWWMARLNLPLTLPLRSGMTGSADRRSSTRSYVPEEVVICWQRPLALLRCRQIMQRWSLSTSSDYFSDPPSSPHVLKSFLPPPPLAILFPGSRAQVSVCRAMSIRFRWKATQPLLSPFRTRLTSPRSKPSAQCCRSCAPKAVVD
jgi:hypothetical protein